MICVRNYRPSVICIGRRLTNSALVASDFSPMAALQHIQYPVENIWHSSATLFLSGWEGWAVQLLRWQLHQYYSLHMKLQCESNIAKAVHSRSLMSCLMSSSLSFGFLDEIASPKSVSQWVMLSDFGDSYCIYRARKLVKVMLTPNKNYLFFSSSTHCCQTCVFWENLIFGLAQSWIQGM